jgi:hypothetical protein
MKTIPATDPRQWSFTSDKYFSTAIYYGKALVAEMTARPSKRREIRIAKAIVDALNTSNFKP